MLILLIDLLKKIGGKKGKLLRFFTPSYGLELEPSRARGLGAIPIIYEPL